MDSQESTPIMPDATENSWKHLALPASREDLGFDAVYDEAETARLMRGFVPSEMEDKWFIYHSGGWLLFHRSWTGICVYGLRLQGSATGTRVVESWVNRDRDQHGGTDIERDRKLVQFLIDDLLLRRAS